MVSREVNVNRPEHSWIPFYRELAEKLVKDDWRDRCSLVIHGHQNRNVAFCCSVNYARAANKQGS